MRLVIASIAQDNMTLRQLDIETVFQYSKMGLDSHEVHVIPLEPLPSSEGQKSRV